MMRSLVNLRSREIGCPTTNRGFPVLCRDGLVEEFTCLKDNQYFIESLDEEAWIPPFACKFSSVPGQEHFLAVADEDGCIRLFNTNLAREKALKTYWLAHTNAVFDVAWAHQQHKLLTASGDQTVAFWDVSRKEKIGLFKGHTSSVKTVNFQPESQDVFASGSRDGHIMLWDSRCAKKDDSIPFVNQIRNAHMCLEKSTSMRNRKRTKLSSQESSQQSVTAVVFQDHNTLVSAGAVDGSVKVWDLRKNHCISKSTPIPYQQFPYAGTSARKHGFSSLCFDSTHTRLFASCMDDVIYEYNCASFSSQPVATYRGHRNGTFYVKATVSPDDQFLLGGSSDDQAYIWKLDGSANSAVVLQGHQGEVTDVAWCPNDITKVATLSDDNSLRIWQVHQPGEAESGSVVGHSLRRVCEKAVSTCMTTNTMNGTSTGILNKSSTHGAIPRKTGSTAKAFKSPNYELPSIKKWLSPKVSEHMKKSPRKIISPRKLCVILSPRKPSPGKSQSIVIDALSPVKYGVKRKLDSSYDQSPLAKKCNLNASVGDKETGDNVQLYSSNESGAYENQSVLNEGRECNHVKKLFAGTSSVCKVKTLVAVVPQSPTSNLPNSVLNPEPRSIYVPVGNKENSPKKTNWLVKLSQQRRTISEDGSPISSRSKRGSVCVDGSPVSSRSRPTSPFTPSPARQSRTILTYFSPRILQGKKLDT